MTDNQDTMKYSIDKMKADQAREILKEVYNALKEKGYNPVNQIVGYLLSGDPTYITSYKNARGLIKKLERDELVEELVKYYLQVRD
ncbi:MAG: IreB family regulatory phosphoprotein [Thermoanaerobacteraceae bacterium]|nr:IreB family regulatory phosphoprotein [Thermoanaerobacteraceae bacterium]